MNLPQKYIKTEVNSQYHKMVIWQSLHYTMTQNFMKFCKSCITSWFWILRQISFPGLGFPICKMENNSTVQDNKDVQIPNYFHIYWDQHTGKMFPCKCIADINQGFFKYSVIYWYSYQYIHWSVDFNGRVYLSYIITSK